jgi:hypothetical protein
MWHALWRGEVFIGFWLGSPKVRDHWENLLVGGTITLAGPQGDGDLWAELDSAGSG